MPEAKADAAMNLYQRIAKVREELGGRMAEGGTAPQSMGSYKFIQYDDVADKVGAAFGKYGVACIPNMTSAECVEVAKTREYVRDGETRGGNPIYRAMVVMRLTFVNVDNPDEHLEVDWWGQGDDSGDKSIQKAATSAFKYALLKLLQLTGGDDTEASTPGEAATSTQAASGGAQPPAARKANSTAPTFKSLLQDNEGNNMMCPKCQVGQVEWALWENGNSRMSCTNWRECDYKEKPVPAIDTAMKRIAAGKLGTAAEPVGSAPSTPPLPF